VVGHQRTASKTRKTLVSTGKISMLQHETASLDALVRIGPGPEYQEKQL